jgi:hypothetical protein
VIATRLPAKFVKRERNSLQFDWRFFRLAITHPCLYVLGAGASLPIIPGNVTERIRKAAWDNGVFAAVYEEPSPLKKRLFTFDIRFEIEALISDSISQNTFDAHTPNALVEALFAREITCPRAALPPQYEIFDFLPKSIVFNFNNDNLADDIDPRHLYLRPHGAVDHEFVHSPIVSRAIALSALPDSFPLYLDFHRPLPESNDMTSRPAYQMLERRFDSINYVVLIGYSFGEQHQDGCIDDVETFEMLASLLRWRPKPVLVIGPDPDRICLRLEQAIRRASVSRLCCKWNVLAEFMLTDGFGRACEQVHRKGLQIISSEYRRFEHMMSRDRERREEPGSAGVIIRAWPLSARRSWPLF